MKKSIMIVLVISMILSFGYAVELESSDVRMTLDDAVQYALKNNTTLVDLRRTADDQEDMYDESKRTYRKWQNKLKFDGGYSFEEPQDYLDCYGYSFKLSELTYNNFIQNVKGAELNVEYTVKSLIYKIQEIKDNIFLLEKSIKKQENDIEIGEVKLRLNMITQDEFTTLKNTLEASKVSLEEMRKSLDTININLKQVLGIDITTNLSIVLSEKEILQFDAVDVENIVENSLVSNVSVILAKIEYQKKYNNYMLATETSWLLRDEIRDAKKEFSDAEFRLNNEINLIRQNLLVLYNDVRNSEKSVAIAKEDLGIAKKKFEQAKTMYEVGLISKNSFLEYEVAFFNSQNNYKAKLNEEALIKDRWNIAISVGDIVN